MSGPSLSINHDALPRGVVIFISPSWQSNIILWGVDPSNQVVWILLEMFGKPFGIVNIKASNNAQKWMSLWNLLSLS